MRMKKSSAELAQSITWTGSKQTYYTARLIVDKDLVEDFYRAYAYFRWIDDIIDITAKTDGERITFTQRQKELIDSLYEKKKPFDLTPEENILADLIENDRGDDSGLQSFIRNMFAIIEFDANRKGRLINEAELSWYLESLAKSVTDGLQYFIGNGHLYPSGEHKYSAAIAAHITHLLRDMLPDTQDGFINIPDEYLDTHHITHDDVGSNAYRTWVRNRVQLARDNFRLGKLYLDELDVLRTKIAGYWYCTRFESVLDTVEKDDYQLRSEYEERRKISTWLKIAWLGIYITFKHTLSR
ncbi:MAG: squalene/phytoene synthase family protein [Anaerolineales bacterium]